MSFPRYAKYKDSGVEWLGEVPEHWDVRRLKHVARLTMGQSPNSDDCNQNGEGVPFLQGNADFGATNPVPRSFCRVATKFSAVDDILFSVRAPVGAINLADQRYGIGRGLCAISTSPGNSPGFQLFALQVVREELFSVATGSTYEAVSIDQVGNATWFNPPSDEQAHIATFLDRETAKIDQLVEEQRRLVALLQEKRRAVISHAVTKGLNPDAPMKPSGVEWLGDVPAHWEVILLKRVFRSVDYGISDALDSDGAVAILRMGNIEDGRIITTDLKFTDAVDPALLLKEGDLLYNRTNSLELIGKVGMFVGNMEVPVSFASYLVRLRTVDSSLPAYFAYFLNTPGILGLARASAFVSIGQCNLNPTRYGQTVVAIPPPDEQAAIVTHLDSRIAELDTLTTEAQHAIDLLLERRAALISAAVTGQIDVRSVVAA